MLSSRWVFRCVLAVLGALSLGYLPYRACGPGGVGRALRLRKQLAELTASNRALQRDNAALHKQIRRLKHDSTAIERVARDELGLLRSDELVFLFEE